MEKIENNIENFERAGVKQRLKKAIEQQDMDSVVYLLQELDRVLIGKESTYNLPEPDKRELEKLLKSKDGTVKIYLGDGGLSRLVISKDNNNVEIFLGLSSTDEVKEKWEELSK